MKKLIAILFLTSFTWAAIEEQVFVQVKFSKVTNKGTYQDALYMTMDEYKASTNESRKVLEQARINSWLESISQAKVAIKATKAELREQKAYLESMLAQVNAEIPTALGE